MLPVDADLSYDPCYPSFLDRISPCDLVRGAERQMHAQMSALQQQRLP